MIEWNPNDPDAARVHYDLAEWDFEQQAELASALAEAEIPHSWAGTELVVPEEFEATTDDVFAEVEQRLGIVGKGTGDATIIAADDEEPIDPRQLEGDEPLTEYPLDDFTELERALVGDSLTAVDVPFRWEDEVLLVPTADEELVENILREIESGDVIPVINDGDDGDELPFESLNSFFLAGQRLRKDPLDADGLERLLDALKIADPNRPPRGVELRVWRRTCELAEQLADALVADEEPDDAVADGIVVDEDGNSFDAAIVAATELHDLLRPLI